MLSETPSTSRLFFSVSQSADLSAFAGFAGFRAGENQEGAVILRCSGSKSKLACWHFAKSSTAWLMSSNCSMDLKTPRISMYS